MTKREVTILLICTAILAFFGGLWFAVKFVCPKERGLDTVTEITKWRDLERKVTDTIRLVEVRREQLAGEVVYVTEYVNRLDSSQLDSCTKDVEPRQLCLEHSLFPVLQAQVKNGDTLAGLLRRQMNLKDSLSEVYRKDGEQCHRDKKKGLNAAKLKGGGIVLGAAAIWQGVKKLFGF